MPCSVGWHCGRGQKECNKVSHKVHSPATSCALAAASPSWWCPGGSFQMGSIQGSNEQPVHTVHIASFALGKYPVTQAQWKR